MTTRESDEGAGGVVGWPRDGGVGAGRWQRLKPGFVCGVFGTTEVVPFHKKKAPLARGSRLNIYLLLCDPPAEAGATSLQKLTARSFGYGPALVCGSFAQDDMG
jgi:hypothetical protein